MSGSVQLCQIACVEGAGGFTISRVWALTSVDVFLMAKLQPKRLILVVISCTGEVKNLQDLTEMESSGGDLQLSCQGG